MSRATSWFRVTWSIRTLLLLTALVSVAIAWQVPRWRKENAIKTLGELGAQLDRKDGEINLLELPRTNKGHFGALTPGGTDPWKDPGRIVLLIAEVDTLETISIVPGDLRSINLAPWLRLRRLRDISIDYGNLSKANLEVIAALPLLESLSLSCSTYDAAALEPLTRCKTLRSLRLSAFSYVVKMYDTPIDDSTEMKLGATRVEQIKPASLNDETLSIIQRIDSIEELKLWGMTTQSKGLEPLRGMESLKQLDLSGTDVDDSVIDVLLSLPNLKEVNLYDSHVTREGVARLVRQSQIESLDVDFEFVEDLKGELTETELARLNRY